ncbi:MAG: hypothetical protein DCC49_01755 [Acidobacteria bacterium]|nr:MAG: hypothetical protein DCC49_01755 [Acidobacteriota bacterium]
MGSRSDNQIAGSHEIVPRFPVSYVSRLATGERARQGLNLAENPKLAELVSIGYESTGLALFDLLQVAQSQMSYPLVIMGRLDEDSLVVEAVAGMSQSGLRPGTAVDLASRFEADVVALRSPVSVPDALSDDHFADRGRRSNVGAYIGVPIMFADGRLFGTLGAYDPNPRAIPKSDIQLMKALARAAAHEIEKTTNIESLTLPGSAPWQKLAGLASALVEIWSDLDESKRNAFSAEIENLADKFGETIAEPVARGAEPDQEPSASLPEENVWPAELDRVIARAPELLPNLPGPRVRIEGDTGVLVDMESRILERIVANLMLNAWRSAPPNTRMTLRAIRHGAWVEFSVEDQSGLSADESRPRRLHPAGRGRIGLPIVMTLVEEAGGSVQQEATEEGRRYTVRLPVLRGVDEPIASVTPLRPVE